jgi:transposase
MLAEGQPASEIAQAFGVSVATVRSRRKRFDEVGQKALNDLPRAGHQETYNETQRGLIAWSAKTNPQNLGLSFEHRTLARLTECVSHTLGIRISRIRLNELLKQAGLRWYQTKTDFAERSVP